MSTRLFFSFDGQYTKDAILKKAERLGLEVVGAKEGYRTTTSMVMPAELFEEDEAKGECVSHD